MPTPEEARLLDIGAGIPVLLWTRTGYSDGRPVRCTLTTFRGDLNRMNYEDAHIMTLDRSVTELDAQRIRRARRRVPAARRDLANRAGTALAGGAA